MSRALVVVLLLLCCSAAAAASAEAPDYWKDVSFGRANFDEVREYVRKRYVVESFDEKWALVEAAAFVLASRDEQPRILLPDSFYLARKEDAREKGRLSGKVKKIVETDRFVILDKSEKQPGTKALSHDEIVAARAWQLERARALRAAWSATDFGPSDFDRVFAFAAPQGVAAKAAWIEASQGYLASLDGHSSLVAKTAWEDSTSKTQDASFEGIGAILTQRPSSPYTLVESSIEGQSAALAGVFAGDELVSVDGIDLRRESLSRVVSRIRGPSGTTVVLTVRREGEPALRQIKVMRRKLAMANVQARLLSDLGGHADVGYVKVTGFVKTTDDDLVAEVDKLSKLTKPGLRGLVLDLRNNSGGLLIQAIKMSDRFLRSGTIVAVTNRNSEEDEVYTASDGDEWQFPVVVLVNAASASAAEIVASALQRNGRALVVGDRTFGKASVQTLYSPLLQDDYYIKLTVAQYRDATGRLLSGAGVFPDITVTPEKNGKLPISFREEQFSGIVAVDEAPAPSELATSAKGCADKSKATGADWQLAYAAAVLSCVNAP